MWAPHSLPDNLRHVGALHLRVADAEGVGRARIAIEDGLACADFGDCGRLIFVRRLALPAFTGQFNGPAAARAIEATFRSLLPDAVHGADPRAASASMVWFADVLDARLAALSRRVEGEALAAWYWRNVDRSFARETEPEIAELFAAIESMSEGAISPVVAMKELARRWRRWSAAGFERFLDALPVLESAAGPAPAPLPISSSPTPIYKSAPPARALAAGAAARLGLAARVAPARVAWLARWELIAADIISPDAPRVETAALVGELLGQALAPMVREHRRPRDVSITTGTDAPRAPEVAAPREVVRTAVAPEPARRDALPATPRESTRLPIALPPWLADARESSCAGFFMLLNAWRAVGVDDFLMGGGEARCDAWLERWARGFGLPVDDVQRFAWRPPSSTPHADEYELGLRRRAARRWLRTIARIGPASLVMRPGAVSITCTHIDVVLPLNGVDLRIRRAGLDQDPGWVSWLGRIVAFHYVEAGNAS